MKHLNYLEINRSSWNNRLETHVESSFYDIASFLDGRSSLNTIELDLLGDVSGKRILHLQCHFGQDSISLARLGASVTAIDLSDKAIEKAKSIAKQSGMEVNFICCDLYSLTEHLTGDFDIVFTSYGTIGWLPDLSKWANIIYHFLTAKGKFIFVEFHPFIWMFDDEFREIRYSYSNEGPIIETEQGTYAQRDADIQQEYVTWNHNLSEVFSSLLEQGLHIQEFKEFDYLPYNCFRNTIEFEPNKFRINHLNNRIPMVYALQASK
ncbi:class I SAM-dependent methyltransferase [Sphingobacterium bambusae]|uniref:Class I SAM-dependent methyltransferase n=1 Tax=Sphingobacterium bambusae TaxID=662858 RepID=A0ABW6BKM2_9SPHI|nr:methyltransferase domain-containing protein [Sphingobacterium bambusae]WPL47995.1 methyltransferase domain-containing protein [Sphingobacterium bambusae]